MQEADPVYGIYGTHGGHETAEVRHVRRSGEGRGLRGGQEKEWAGCLLENLRAFGINADQWTTAAQDERERRKTAGQFMATWIASEKARAGLRHAVGCPNATGRTKDRIAQSERAHLLAIVDWPEVARTCILRAVCRCVTSALFCFAFVFLLSLNPRPFVQSFFDREHASTATRS